MKFTVSEELAYKCLIEEYKIANNKIMFVLMGDEIVCFNDEDDWLEL